LQASGRVIAFRYIIIVPDEARRPFPVRFEGGGDIVEQAESFCRRILRVEGAYETVIETAEGLTIIEEGRLGEMVGDPLYRHVCRHCGTSDWYDIPSGNDDTYLCHACTFALCSRLRVTDAMLN
jgi:hypothetical protein